MISIPGDYTASIDAGKETSCNRNKSGQTGLTAVIYTNVGGGHPDRDHPPPTVVPIGRAPQ
jgi:hypothetical protein